MENLPAGSIARLMRRSLSASGYARANWYRIAPSRRPTLQAREVQELLDRSVLVGNPPRPTAAAVNACAALRDLLRVGTCHSDGASMAGAD